MVILIGGKKDTKRMIGFEHGDLEEVMAPP